MRRNRRPPLKFYEKQDILFVVLHPAVAIPGHPQRVCQMHLGIPSKCGDFHYEEM
jgi:hypothetical protein